MAAYTGERVSDRALSSAWVDRYLSKVGSRARRNNCSKMVAIKGDDSSPGES